MTKPAYSQPLVVLRLKKRGMVPQLGNASTIGLGHPHPTIGAKKKKKKISTNFCHTHGK